MTKDEIKNPTVAQQSEPVAHNGPVVGANPTSGTKEQHNNDHVALLDSASVTSQGRELRTSNSEVEGSSPSVAAKDEIQAACESLYALRVYARSCDDNIAWHFDTIDKLTDTIRAALQSALDTFKNTENVNVSGEQADAVEVPPSQNGEANITCPSEIREKIGIAIGEASMCWSEPPHGVFDSARANRILEEVYQYCVAAPQVKPETVDVEELFNLSNWHDDASYRGAQADLINYLRTTYPQGLKWGVYSRLWM